MTGFAHKSRSEQQSPPFQGGEVRDIKLERREATLCGANGVVKIEPRRAPYFVEVTNLFLLLRPIGLALRARLRQIGTGAFN